MAEQVDIRQMVRDYHRGVTRRKNAALQQVGDAIAAWMVENLTGPLRPDWRETFRAVLANQAAQGRKVIPQSAAAYEAAIEQYAALCARLGRYPRTPNSHARVVFNASEHGIARLQQGTHATLVSGSPANVPQSTVRPHHARPGADPLAQIRREVYRATFREGTMNRPFTITYVPSVSGPGGPGNTSSTPGAVFVDGVQVAGPGPTVSDSYKLKVQRALETLDLNVASWWKTKSVNGQIRSRDARFWQFGYYSKREAHDQPFIYVDQDFTAGQTAQAIIEEANTGWFADSIGAHYKKHRLAQTGDVKEFTAWQRGAVSEAGRLASVLAELYVGGIASLSPSGDLIVTIDDVAENGLRWQQLLSILPFVGHLPIAAIVIKVAKRKIGIPKGLARELENLATNERKVLLAKAANAKSDDEAAAIIKRGVTARDKSKRKPSAGSAAGLTGPGRWVAETESMSAQARAYQTQISGRQEIYVVNGVKFDGYSNGTLLEAKGPGYVRFVKEDGFHAWFTKLPNIIEQANRQRKAAGQLPVVWHIADQEMVTALRKVFHSKGIPIPIVHTPAIHK